MARVSRSSKRTTSGASLGAIKRQRTARLTRVATRAAMLQRRGHYDEAYTLVCDEFMHLGGIYIKFLQGVLLNSPIMKRWHNPNRLKVFEGVDSEPLDIIELLRSELSSEQLSQIAKIQSQPFASGSFGQVYYGELKSGQQIIVKALKPHIRDLLQHDLRLISLFSRFFVGRQYTNIDMKLDDAIKDFRKATLAETDYVREANFAVEMYDAQTDNPDVIIPKTYLELCTPRLIVQDYVGGISCAELLEKYTNEKIDPTTYAKERLGSDLQIQLEKLGIALLNGCFEQPRIMGDPHPGNIRLLPDNKVALIDFGISAPAPHNRAAFFGLIREWAHMYDGTLNIPNLFEQFLRVFVNDLYRALKKVTSMRPQQEAQDFNQSVLKNVGNVIKDLFDGEAQTDDLLETMNQGRLLRLFSQVINKGNRLGLVIKVDDSEMLRAAQTYMSTVESLGLRAEVLSVVFNTVVKQQLIEHPELSGNHDRQLSTSQALEVINGWLERVANKDPLLFRRMLQQVSVAGYGTVDVKVPEPESDMETASDEAIIKEKEPEKDA